MPAIRRSAAPGNLSGILDDAVTVKANLEKFDEAWAAADKYCTDWNLPLQEENKTQRLINSVDGPIKNAINGLKGSNAVDYQHLKNTAPENLDLAADLKASAIKENVVAIIDAAVAIKAGAKDENRLYGHLVVLGRLLGKSAALPQSEFKQIQTAFAKLDQTTLNKDTIDAFNQLHDLVKK